jgi:hypothetical protein
MIRDHHTANAEPPPPLPEQRGIAAMREVNRHVPPVYIYNADARSLTPRAAPAAGLA